MTNYSNDTPAHAPAITWLNMTGDVTITWDKHNEAAILALIEAKMADGFSFFIVKPRFFGLLGTKKVSVSSIAEIRKAGKVVATDDSIAASVLKLDDAAVESVVKKGHATLLKGTSVPKETVRRAKTAAEVLQHQTVAIRPIVGG